MQFHQQIDVALPPARVWEALEDVELVAQCIPGAELAGSDLSGADGDYKGSLTVRFGPKAIKFNGGVHYERDVVERTAAITGSGQDLRSKTRVRTTVHVTVARATAATMTRLTVDGDMQIAGPLASLVEAGAEQVARQIVDDFAVNLRSRLEAGPPAGELEVRSPRPSHFAHATAGSHTQGVNVGSVKTLMSIVWATLRRWLRMDRP